MMIPPTEGDSDTTGPRLDQTSGHQELFHQFRGPIVPIAGVSLAITGHDCGVLVLEIQGTHQTAGGQDAESLLGIGISPGQLTAGVDLATEAIESP